MYQIINNKNLLCNYKYINKNIVYKQIYRDILKILIQYLCNIKFFKPKKTILLKEISFKTKIAIPQLF